jgi:hypothetical protein
MCKAFEIIFCIVSYLFSFCVAVSEAVFLAKYQEYSDECRQIWKWILASCVFNIVVAVAMCCGIGRIIKEATENILIMLWFDFWFYVGIGSLVTSIWSAVIYFNISSSCHDFWSSNAPQLYTFVLIHFI